MRYKRIHSNIESNKYNYKGDYIIGEYIGFLDFYPTIYIRTSV